MLIHTLTGVQNPALPQQRKPRERTVFPRFLRQQATARTGILPMRQSSITHYTYTIGGVPLQGAKGRFETVHIRRQRQTDCLFCRRVRKIAALKDTQCCNLPCSAADAAGALSSCNMVSYVISFLRDGCDSGDGKNSCRENTVTTVITVTHRFSNLSVPSFSRMS